ncbi:MAG: hypothetical protein ABMA64_36650 [Myxococcota bacterium]
MTPATIVPVVLGCCPHPPRCLLCAPPPGPTSADVVRALIHNYRDRAGPEAPLRVGFYGGAPPSDAQLDALDGLPFHARVRPDLLTRSEAARLVDRGAVGIELDALTFDDVALRAAGRKYSGRQLDEQLAGIAALGAQPGIVLAPGLPHTDHPAAVRDAERAAPAVRFARIHPVLVLARSGLHDAHMEGRYVALELGEAVTTCRVMLDVFDAAGVEVIRIGVNPGPDGVGRAVAGPRHPALRQLVEARRALEVLLVRAAAARRGSRIEIRCHPADETTTRGPRNQHVRTLRAAHGLAAVTVRPDPSLPRGEYVIDEVLT